ncbi:MAG: hypothetical protein MJA84_16305, partial [Firmicutes bacterium]|nr:hypothetical protein [Bacillota bacterium]
PFPAGTKTVRQKQLDEDTRRYNQEWPYIKRRHEYELSKPYYKPSAGGGVESGAPNLSQSERFGATLSGAIDNMSDLIEQGRQPYTDNWSLETPEDPKAAIKAALDETMRQVRKSSAGLGHTQISAVEEHLAAHFGIDLGESDTRAMLKELGINPEDMGE